MHAYDNRPATSDDGFFAWFYDMVMTLVSGALENTNVQISAICRRNFRHIFKIAYGAFGNQVIRKLTMVNFCRSGDFLASEKSFQGFFDAVNWV
jgi:hypothetical protein